MRPETLNKYIFISIFFVLGIVLLFAVFYPTGKPDTLGLVMYAKDGQMVVVDLRPGEEVYTKAIYGEGKPGDLIWYNGRKMSGQSGYKLPDFDGKK